MKPATYLPLFVLALVACGACGDALGQELVPPDPDSARLANAPAASQAERRWRLQLGAGVLYGPAFLGSSDFQLRAGPSIDVCYRERLCLSMVDGATFDLVRTDALRAGPIVKYQDARRENGDNLFVIAGGRAPALRGLGDVDATVEAGGYVQYRTGPLSAKVEVRKGLGGHEGLIADLGLRLSASPAGLSILGRPIVLSMGPRATLVDGTYNRAYFGIDETQSARSGLRRYEPRGGLLSIGLGAAVVLPVTANLSAALRGGVDRLAGDASRSPLVRERGAREQGTIGLGLVYRMGP